MQYIKLLGGNDFPSNYQNYLQIYIAHNVVPPKSDSDVLLFYNC